MKKKRNDVTPHFFQSPALENIPFEPFLVKCELPKKMPSNEEIEKLYREMINDIEFDSEAKRERFESKPISEKWTMYCEQVKEDLKSPSPEYLIKCISTFPAAETLTELNKQIVRNRISWLMRFLGANGHQLLLSNLGQYNIYNNPIVFSNVASNEVISGSLCCLKSLMHSNLGRQSICIFVEAIPHIVSSMQTRIGCCLENSIFLLNEFLFNSGSNDKNETLNKIKITLNNIDKLPRFSWRGIANELTSRPDRRLVSGIVSLTKNILLYLADQPKIRAKFSSSLLNSGLLDVFSNLTYNQGDALGVSIETIVVNLTSDKSMFNSLFNNVIINPLSSKELYKGLKKVIEPQFFKSIMLSLFDIVYNFDDSKARVFIFLHNLLTIYRCMLAHNQKDKFNVAVSTSSVLEKPIGIQFSFKTYKPHQVHGELYKTAGFVCDPELATVNLDDIVHLTDSVDDLLKKQKQIEEESKEYKERLTKSETKIQENESKITELKDIIKEKDNILKENNETILMYQDENDKLQAEINMLKEEIKSMNNKLTDINNINQNQTNEIQKLVEKCNKTEDDNKQKIELIEKLTYENKEKNDKINNINEQLESLNNEKKEFKDQIVILQEQISLSDKEKEQKNSEIQENNLEISKLNEENRQKDNTINEYKLKIEKLNEENKQKEDIINGNSTVINNLNEEIQQKNDAIKEHTSVISELNDLIQQKEDIIKERDIKIQNIEQQNQSENDTISELNIQIQNLNNEKEEHNSIINELKQQISQLNEDNKQKEETIKNNESEISKLNEENKQKEDVIKERDIKLQNIEQQTHSENTLVTELNVQIQNLNNEKEEHNSIINELKQQISQLNEESKQKNDSIQIQNDKILNLEEQIQTRDKTLEQQNNEFQNLMNDCNQKEKEIEELKSKVQIITNDNNKKDENIQELQLKISDISQENDNNSELNQKMELLQNENKQQIEEIEKLQKSIQEKEQENTFFKAQYDLMNIKIEEIKSKLIDYSEENSVSNSDIPDVIIQENIKTILSSIDNAKNLISTKDEEISNLKRISDDNKNKIIELNYALNSRKYKEINQERSEIPEGERPPKKESNAPEFKVIRLDWTRLDDSCIKQQLWSSFEEEKIPFDPRAFSINYYLSPLRQKRISEFLTNNRQSPADVLQNIRKAVKSSPYNEYQLKEIYDMIPNQEELDYLETIKRNDIQSFWYDLGTIPCISLRIKLFYLQRTFSKEFTDHRETIQIVESGMKELSSSQKFHLLLSYILKIGNYLNGGTPNGGAYGFTLDSLKEVKYTPIINFAITCFPNISSIDKDFQNLFKCTNIEFITLYKQLSHNFEIIKQCVDIIEKHEIIVSNNDSFYTFLEFFKESYFNIASEIYNNATSAYNTYKTYLESFAEPKDEPLSIFVQKIQSFCKDVNDAAEEKKEKSFFKSLFGK